MRYYPASLARDPDVRALVSHLTPAQRRRGIAAGQSVPIESPYYPDDQFRENMSSGARIRRRVQVRDLAPSMENKEGWAILESLFGYVNFFTPGRGDYALWLPVRGKRRKGSSAKGRRVR